LAEILKCQLPCAAGNPAPDTGGRVLPTIRIEIVNHPATVGVLPDGLGQTSAPALAASA